MPNDAINFAGDLTLPSVTVIGVSGNAINIRPQVLNIEIFETIFYPFTTAKIYITEREIADRLDATRCELCSMARRFCVRLLFSGALPLMNIRPQKRL